MTDVSFNTVKTLADGLGFGLCGVATARGSDHADDARRWVADGKHGEMAYLAEHLETRLDPERLLPGVRSVVVVADAYAGEASGETGPEREESTPRGKVAKYAWGRDYHKVIKKRLHKLSDALREACGDPVPGTETKAEFRATVDTAPVFEREHAARAGLGWTGKHTLLLHPRHGSFFLLGLVLTTLEIESSESARYPGSLIPGADHCANCTRCIDACPTDAIAPEGYSLDATKCISYLTIEHRSPIDPELHAGMGEWIAGCDVCQDVCPYNVAATKPGHALPVLPDYAPRAHSQGFDLLDVLSWDEDARLKHTAGTSLTRIKLPMWKRNALIAAGNTLEKQNDPELRDAVAHGRGDDDALVRDTAEQVWRRINPDR